MLNLEPIKARLAAATPGPWRQMPSKNKGGVDRFVGPPGCDPVCGMSVINEKWGDDMTLIANAPADLAALVAEVERLRGRDQVLESEESIYVGDFNGYKYYLAPSRLNYRENWQKAQDYCASLTIDGYSDWYLPNKEELNFLFQNVSGKHFISSNYWSSSEYLSLFAWAQDFLNGFQGTYDITALASVCAIRKEKLSSPPLGGIMLNLEPIKARLATAAHIWLWWWDEATQKYAISTDAGNNVSLWAERREDAAEVCKNHKTLLALIGEVELLREHAEVRKAQVLPILEQAAALKRQHEVSQAQIRAYEKALGWYADPANWIEQVDDRGRETMLWKWAEDGGDMARHALAVWRESRKAEKNV